MRKRATSIGLSSLLALTLSAPLPAQVARPPASESGTERWQVRRLHEPTPAELARERQGSVYIYENFTDRSVDHAMDAHFDRIQSMMFIGTIVTGEGGEQLTDPVTGEPVTEEDGCD